MISVPRSSIIRRLETPFQLERAFLRAFLLMLALAIAGCATRPGAEALIPSAQKASGAKLVTMLVATDRAPDGPGLVGYGSGRASLRFEELTVSVPPGHQSGGIEWTQGTAHDPSRSFVLVKRRGLDETAFRQRAAARIRTQGTAGIFVHGYNYTLPEAAFRLAQLKADSSDVGVPILFSWPSEAAVTGYVADRDAVTYARDDLVRVLDVLSGIPTKRKIVLAGHSMGGWLVMEALRQLRLQKRNAVIDRFEVALAAPDIDVDVFRKQLSVIGPLKPPLTILVSSDDRALDVSRQLAGGRPRVGAADVQNPLLEAVARREKLRIVDISSVESSDGTKHDRFVRFIALQARETSSGAISAGSLRQAGAFVFNAAGAAVSSPFTLAGRAIAGQ